MEDNPAQAPVTSITISIEVVVYPDPETDVDDLVEEARDYLRNELEGQEIDSESEFGARFEFCDNWEDRGERNEL